MTNLLKICYKISDREAVNFRLQSKAIDAEKLFAEEGLLPSIMKRADQLSLLLFGEKTGAKFRESEKSMLGVEVDIESCEKITAYLTVADVLMELIKNGKNGIVEVGELLYD